jgi:hypothetical protein
MEKLHVEEKKLKTNTRKKKKNPTGKRKNAKAYLWYFPGLYNILCKPAEEKNKYSFTHSRLLLVDYS